MIYYIQVHCSNVQNFINLLIKYNIDCNEIKQLDNNTITFYINRSNYNQFKNNKFLNIYQFKILKTSGFYLPDLIKSRIGILIGLILSISLMMFTSNIILGYSITGNSDISDEQIEKAIEEYGIKTGKINFIDNGKLEIYLADYFNQISLVSVMTHGNVLFVNINEKVQKQQSEFEPIIANENLLINKISVVMGSSDYQVGDVVKKGQTIINPFYFDNVGNKIDCQAIGQVEGDIWYTGVVEQNKIIETTQLTGNKITNLKVYFGTKLLYSKINKVEFESYESKIENIKFTNMFLPITIVKQHFYQTKITSDNFNLEQNKQSLLHQSEQIALSKLNDKYIHIDTSQNIKEFEDKYLFITNIRCSYKFSNIISE